MLPFDGLDFADVVPFPTNIPVCRGSSITPVNPIDPSLLGYPPTLLVELALRTNPLEEVLDAHCIGYEEWERIRMDPVFAQELARVVEALKVDGAGFVMKAKLQAESLLKTSWEMIHDPVTPATVRADLIKSTVKWSGLEPAPSRPQTDTAGTGFSININFGAAGMKEVGNVLG